MERYKGSFLIHLFTLFLSCLLFSAAATAQTYCSAKASVSSYEWIRSVSLAGYSQTTDNNNGYGDFTAQTIALNEGANPIVLTPGFSNSSYVETWRVWIDFNQDKVFSTDELVFSGTSSGVLAGSLIIPDTAMNGITRMRVMMQYGGVPQPCTSPYYGEVEDYSVMISSNDITPPAILAKTPVNSASNINVHSPISIQFSEKIDPHSVTPSTILIRQNGIPIAAQIQVVDSFVTLTPLAPLEYSSLHEVSVYAGIMDLSSNATQFTETWTFTTEAADMIGPVIITRSPLANAVDVATNSVIQVKFSEPVNPQTVTPLSFQVLQNGVPVAGNLSVVMNQTLVQFYPAQSFQTLTSYEVNVSADIKDVAGNPMLDPEEWSFTTREPQLSYCSSYATNYSLMWISKVRMDNYTFTSASAPATGYSNNTHTVIPLSRSSAKSFELTPGFSSGLYPVYWRIYVDWNQNGSFSSDELAFSGTGTSARSGSFTVPSHAVAGNTRMRISMQYGSYPASCGSLSYGEVEDYRVNIPNLVDTTPPSIQAVTPANASNNVAVTTVLEANVSEDVLITSLANALQLNGNDQTVAVTATYHATTKNITFLPVTPLEHSTAYTATLGGIKDIAGNTMVGSHVWSFTTTAAPLEGNSISGQIHFDNVGLESVSISISGADTASVFTDSNGYFHLSGLASGDYVITPVKPGFAFSPASLVITIDGDDVDQVDFSVSALSNVLINGDFDQGNFTPFQSFTTVNGVANKSIVIFDTNADGIASPAAVFSVGVKSGTPIGTDQGGGIYQVVGLNQGSLYVSAEIAASATGSNGAGGKVSLLLNGEVMDSHDFGSITGGVKEYATLSFGIPEVLAGNYEIRLLMTRSYVSGPVSNYVDNIVVTGTSTY